MSNHNVSVINENPIIQSKDLRFSFGETPALVGASVEVKRGEILAVMGPSGSGKSTLLHCLAGILVPDSGEVLFNDIRIDTMREQERSALRRDHFGFVFQFGQLVPELTAVENVALPLLLAGIRRGPALREAGEWFDRLDIAGLEQQRSGEMSGGQAQRVALARSLVANPDIVFADEPTGSLDSLSGELVMKLLTTTARDQGTTVILVTHEPRVAAYADREVVVRDGHGDVGHSGPWMIRLGLRLTFGSGREAALRFLSRRRPSRSVSASCWRPWPVSTDFARKPAVGRGSTPPRRRRDRHRRPTDCGGCRAPTSSALRRLTGSTWPRPARTHRSRQDCATYRDRVSTTRRPPSPTFCATNRPINSATVSRGARSAPSAPRHFHPPTL